MRRTLRGHARTCHRARTGWPWREGAGAFGSAREGDGARASGRVCWQAGRWDTAGAGEKGCAPRAGPCAIRMTLAGSSGREEAASTSAASNSIAPAKPGPGDEEPGSAGHRAAPGAALLGPGGPGGCPGEAAGSWGPWRRPLATWRWRGQPAQGQLGGEPPHSQYTGGDGRGPPRPQAPQQGHSQGPAGQQRAAPLPQAPGAPTTALPQQDPGAEPSPEGPWEVQRGHGKHDLPSASQDEGLEGTRREGRCQPPALDPGVGQLSEPLWLTHLRGAEGPRVTAARAANEEDEDKDTGPSSTSQLCGFLRGGWDVPGPAAGLHSAETPTPGRTAPKRRFHCVILPYITSSSATWLCFVTRASPARLSAGDEEALASSSHPAASHCCQLEHDGADSPRHVQSWG